MMKRGQYYLRLVSRLCIAFALVFSIMLGTCVNDVFALTQITYAHYDEQSWTSPMTYYSMDGSAVNGQWVGSLSYNIPQLVEDKEYIFLVSIQPTVTQYDPKYLLETDIEYYVIFSGHKYYFDASNHVWFKVSSSDNAVNNLFSVGFDVYYSVEPYKVTDTTAYMYTNITMGCELQLFEVDENESANDIISNLQQGNQLQQEENQLQQDANELQQEQNQTTNNIFSSISEFFGSFFDNLIGIFVPEDGYFEEYFERLNNFFSDKLGMLYAPIDIFVDILNAISEGGGSTGITFPELKWEEYTLIEEQTIDLQTIADDLGDLQEYIYFGTDVIMVGAVIGLLQSKLREVLKT